MNDYVFNNLIAKLVGFIEAENKIDYVQQYPELLTLDVIQYLDLLRTEAETEANEAEDDGAIFENVRADLISLALDQQHQQLAQLWQTNQFEAAIILASQIYDFATQTLGQTHPLAVSSLYDLALMCKTIGDYSQAEPLYHLVIDLSRQVFGEDHLDVATCLDDLAGLYQATGEYGQAEPLYHQALAIQRAALGENHPDVATSLHHLAEFYRTIGDNVQAETFCRQALEIRREVLGEQHLDFGNSLNTLALLCDAKGDYTQAEALFHQVLTILRATKGEYHPYFAVTLNSLADLYQTTGNYSQARPLFEKIVEIHRNTLDENHPNIGTSLNNLGAFYRTTGEYARAEAHLNQALEIRRAVFGEQHPEFAYSLNQLAMLYAKISNYAQAESLYQQTMAIYRATLGEDHTDFAACLNNLANLYKEHGDYRQARPLFQQAVEITRVTLGEQHPDFATCLSNLASFYRNTGDYIQAEPLFQQALGIRQTAFGEQHPDVAASLNDLGMFYLDTGDYAQAELLCQQALEINRTILGEQHPDFAESLSKLAGVYRKLGIYVQAKPLFQQAAEIKRTIFGAAHPDYALSLNNLALLYREMGHYARAKPLFQQAIDITRSTTSGEQSETFAYVYNNFAQLYQTIGDYSQAESLFQQALKIWGDILGQQHPIYAQGLDNLAKLYQAMEDYSQAEPLYQQALEIRRTVLGEHHYDFTETLHNLASLYDAVGDYDQAERLYQEVIDIRGAAEAKQHAGIATSLNNLALLYKRKGDYAQAEPLYRQAMEITRTALGEQHPDFAASLTNLASLCAATDRPIDAMTLMTQALTIRDQLIGQIFSIGSESQRMAYLYQMSGYTDFFFSLIFNYQADQAEGMQQGLDLLLRAKALGAEGLAVQRDAVLSGRYPDLEAQFHELNYLRQQIAAKTLNGPGPEGLLAHQQQLTEWHSQLKTLEANLAGQIPEMNLAQKLQDIDRHIVAQTLPESTILIEFMRFNVFDFKAIPAQGDSQQQAARYLAFVLPAGQPDNVSMIDLGDADPIDRLIVAYRATITGETDKRSLFYGDEGLTENSSEGELSQQLCAAVFGPLLPALGQYRRLFISPDGDLSRLPFEILLTDAGHRLIETYQISYVNTGRDILRIGAAYTGEPTAPVVVADPDFDLAVPEENPGDSKPPAAIDGRQSRDLDRVELHFGRLPGTRLEGEKIADMLAAVTMFGPEAVESRFKQIQSPRILHIATHGFFLPNQPAQPSPESVNPTIAAPSSGRLAHNLENPLLRSGLALAGANTWLRRGPLPAEAEDALFNGEDVTALDLLATELVVLSACETGLGEVQIGEGVFGLRRAFVLAGASTLVMSLWSVPDQQTQALMTDFYQRILAGEPRAEALRQAQLALKAKYPNPFYWGAFICQGDPGPLERTK